VKHDEESLTFLFPVICLSRITFQSAVEPVRTQDSLLPTFGITKQNSVNVIGKTLKDKCTNTCSALLRLRVRTDQWRAAATWTNVKYHAAIVKLIRCEEPVLETAGVVNERLFRSRLYLVGLGEAGSQRAALRFC